MHYYYCKILEQKHNQKQTNNLQNTSEETTGTATVISITKETACMTPLLTGIKVLVIQSIS